METTVAGFIIFTFCMIGSGLTCWHLGRKVGIECAVDYLIANGMIEVDD